MPFPVSAVEQDPAILSADEFGAAITPVMPALTRYARRLAVTAADTEDLVQDTLLKAWAARASFAPGTNLRAWLMRIARNTFLSSRRRAGRQVLWEPEEVARALTTGTEQESAVMLGDLTTAVAALPMPQQQAFELVAVEHLSYEEAASRLGVEVGTLKSRVSRARMVLVRSIETMPQSRLPKPMPAKAVEAPIRGSIYATWKASGGHLIGELQDRIAA